jgi:hypothetical protein
MWLRKPLPEALHRGMLVCVMNFKLVFFGEKNKYFFCINSYFRNNFNGPRL